MLLSEAVAMMIAQRQAENYSPCTVYQDRSHLSKLITHLRDPDVSAVTLLDLRRFVAHRAPGLKPATVAQHVRRIRSCFRWMVEEEILGKSPAVRLKEPKVPDAVPKDIPFETLELIRDACQTVREKALVEFLFATGCRASEVAGVKRHDVDWNRRAVVVMGKGRKEREVYFGARATLRLKRYLKGRQDDCEHLFIAERGPARPTSGHQIWYAVKRIAGRVGLRAEIWPHRLRHTLATTLLNQGMDLVDVQGLLGHVKPETTMRYARRKGAIRQQAYERHFIQ